MLEIYATDEKEKDSFIRTLADFMAEVAKSDEFKFMPEEDGKRNQSGTLFLYDIALQLCHDFHVKERGFDELHGLAAAAKLAEQDAAKEAEEGDALNGTLNAGFNVLEFLRSYWKYSEVTFFDCMAFFASAGDRDPDGQFSEFEADYLRRFATTAAKCATNFIAETKILPPDAYDMCTPAFAFYEDMQIRFSDEGWNQPFERCAKEVGHMVWNDCDGSLDYMRRQLAVIGSKSPAGSLTKDPFSVSDAKLHKKIRQLRYQNESGLHFVGKHAIGFFDDCLSKVWGMFEQAIDESYDQGGGVVLDEDQISMFKAAVDRAHKVRSLFIAMFDKTRDEKGGTYADNVPERDELILMPNRDAKGWHSWIDPYTKHIRSDPQYSQEDIITWSRNIRTSVERHMKLYTDANDTNGIIQSLNVAVLAEHTVKYHADGFPYFKIEPCIAGELMVSDVNVLASTLRTAYDSFAILLKHGSGIKKKVVDESIRSHEVEPTAIAVQLIELTDGTPTKTCDLSRIGYSFKTNTDLNRMMFMTVQYAEIINGKPIRCDYETCHTIYFNDDDCLEDAFVRRQVEAPDELDEFDFAIFRLAVSTCFFSVENHEFIQPDIPRKLVTRFAKANKDKNDADRDKVLEEARKKGFTGKIIREIDLPLDEVRYENREPSGTRGPISYGYFRRAHWRQQKTNDGVKAVFIKRHRVRPDLPLKPFHGYALRDELVKRKQEFIKQQEQLDEPRTMSEVLNDA